VTSAGSGPEHAAGFRTQTEEVSDERLPVEGSLPGWLAGQYVRNGPGQFEVGDTALGHWFDPLAMLRSFSVGDGVTYTNRFVRSRDFEYAREHGRVRAMLPGTPPDRSLPTRLYHALTGVFQDNPSVGVARIGGEHVAVTESPWGLCFDPDTLETKGRVDLTAGLDCDITLGHPHYDHEAGRLVNLGVSYGRETVYTLFERTDSEPEPVTRLRFDEGPYVHSFALTPEYAVLTAGPFGLDASRLLTGAARGRTFLDAFEAFDGPTRFLVIDRASGELATVVEAPPTFVYHHANAFRDGDDLVVDLVGFPDDRAIGGLLLENLRAPEPDLPTGDLVRYRLPLGGSSEEAGDVAGDDNEGDRTRVEPRRLYPGPVEFPTVAYRRYGGRPYRYVYLAKTDGSSGLPTRLVKVDTERGTATAWEQPGAYPGEAIFVPAPDPATEDDGVLLSVVLDPDAGRSVLVCLDAVTMTELARAPLPHRLPYGFHGQFYGPTAPERSMP
jgi:carotenoid cleavage dioxygenase-like enzyme